MNIIVKPDYFRPATWKCYRSVQLYVLYEFLPSLR